jgi:hypothetical protein
MMVAISFLFFILSFALEATKQGIYKPEKHKVKLHFTQCPVSIILFDQATQGISLIVIPSNTVLCHKKTPLPSAVRSGLVAPPGIEPGSTV